MTQIKNNHHHRVNTPSGSHHRSEKQKIVESLHPSAHVVPLATTEFASPSASGSSPPPHSTVTLLARFLGWSTLHLRMSAM